MLRTRAAGSGKAAACAKPEEELRLFVSARGSGRHWKSTDVPKQWDIMIQKCEMQGGILPGPKPTRNFVLSGLGDSKETFVSLTKFPFMCSSFGKNLRRSGCCIGSSRHRSWCKPGHQSDLWLRWGGDILQIITTLFLEKKKSVGRRTGKAVGAESGETERGRLWAGGGDAVPGSLAAR